MNIIAVVDYSTPWTPIPQINIRTLSVSQKISRYNFICNRRRNASNPDVQAPLEMTIFDLINKTRNNLMKDGNLKNRFDINAKKILRASRAYYDHKLEYCFEFKKLRRKISRS